VRGSGLGGGIGAILYSDRGALREHFTYNAVGHTVALTDTLGTPTKTDLYEAFGNITSSTGASANNRLANTKERDASIGLDNHGFRYYDPEIGRYISRDPIGYGDGLNVYAYVHNNPINFYDPLGLGYWADVGQVFMGYGDAAVGTVVGVGTMVVHPVQTAKGIGHAVAHPVQTGKAIAADYKNKAGSLRGQGSIVGEILITVGTAGAGATAQGGSKAGQVARIVSKVDAALPDEVAAYADDVARIASQNADDAARVAANQGDDVGRSVSKVDKVEGTSLDLKYKEGWTDAQRAAADAKVKALNETGDLKVTKHPQRLGTASNRYKKAGGEVQKGQDVDHVKDLQLGGADDVSNMRPLDSSVNRSLGPQIQNRTKDLPAGARIDRVTISD
jgi:RHS repeat-associated protein